MMIVVLIELVAFLFIGYKLVQKVKHMQSLTGREAQKEAFLKITRTMVFLTVLMLTAIAVLIALLATHNPWIWFGLFILCRLMEFAVILLLLHLVKIPRAPEMDTSAMELSETKRTQTITLTRTATANSNEREGSASS